MLQCTNTHVRWGKGEKCWRPNNHATLPHGSDTYPERRSVTFAHALVDEARHDVIVLALVVQELHLRSTCWSRSA